MADSEQAFAMASDAGGDATAEGLKETENSTSDVVTDGSSVPQGESEINGLSSEQMSSSNEETGTGNNTQADDDKALAHPEHTTDAEAKDTLWVT